MAHPIPRPVRSSRCRRPRALVGTAAPALAGLLLALLAAAPAPAQSQGDLRRENERLRQEKAELEAQVARLEAALAEAEASAAALQQRLAEIEERTRADTAKADDAARADGATGADGGGEAVVEVAPPVVTVDETKPEASPRAIRAEARRRWEAGPGRLDRGRDAGSPERINYLRALETWVREQERTWRMDVRWIVRPVEAPREEPVGIVWRMRAHDPVSDAPLGAPFDVRVRPSAMRSLERAVAVRAADGEPTEPLVLRGRVVVRFTVDPRRGEAGPFDRPPLLAPFVAFEAGIDATSLAPRPAARVGLGGEDGDDEHAGSGAGSGTEAGSAGESGSAGDPPAGGGGAEGATDAGG